MLKLEKLLLDSQSLNTSFISFKQLAIKIQDLLQMKNTNQYSQIQQQITLIKKLQKIIARIRVHYYQLSSSVVNLDSALSLAVRQAGELSQQISKSLKNKGGYYANYAFIAEDIFNLTSSMQKNFISNGWKSYQVEATKQVITNQQQMKVSRVKTNMTNSMLASQTSNYQRIQLPEVNEQETCDISTQIRQIQLENDELVQDCFISAKNETIYKKILSSYLQDQNEKFATFTVENQLNPVQIKYQEPEKIPLYHNFKTVEKVLDFKQNAPNFTEFYEKLNFLKLKISIQKVSVLFKKSYQTCKKYFNDFLEFQKFAFQFDFPFQFEEIFTSKLQKIIFKIQGENTEFQAYLNDLICSFWHAEMTNFDSFNLCQISRDEMFNYSCFLGDSVDKNDVSLVIFQGVCMMYLAGYRIGAEVYEEEDDVFPEMIYQ